MLQFSHQVELLGRTLDVTQLRHRVISQNLANVNTPGYQRGEVDFENALRQSLAGAERGHSGQVEAVVRRQVGGAHRADGNNVDIDVEIGELNSNALLYQTCVEVLSTQLSQMRAAISSS